MKAHIATAFAFVCASGFASAGEACPDMRAVTHHGVSQESAAGTRCQRVLRLFGLTINLGGGEHCPAIITVFPTHRDCIAVPGSGTDCEFTQELAVTELRCRCGPLPDVDFGIVEAPCNCTEAGTSAIIADHRTIDCVDA
jgi:hypothetical protein